MEKLRSILFEPLLWLHAPLNEGSELLSLYDWWLLYGKNGLQSLAKLALAKTGLGFELLETKCLLLLET